MSNTADLLKVFIAADSPEFRRQAQVLPTEERTPHAGALLKQQEVHIVDETTMTNCHCGKPRPITQLPTKFSGAVHYTDNICPGTSCGKGLEKLATIVCANKGCRLVVNRISPQKDKDGFEYKAGEHYHVKGCPACTPGIAEAKIIEKIVWTTAQQSST